MKISSYSSRDVAINAAVDLTKDLQTPRPESPFQVGYYQLKAIKELDNISDEETKTPNRDSLPTPPSPLMNNRSKLPRVEYQTALPQSVDLDEEYKDREQKLPIPTQETAPSAATREKYTKKQKELAKQPCRGH